MTLPVFRADGDLEGVAVGGTVTVTGAEARHATTVQRLNIGEELDVVDGHGTRATAEITETGKELLRVRIRTIEHEPQRMPRLTLVQALAKGDRDLQAVESCTELGADRVLAWQADRSIARFRAEKLDKQLDKWRNTMAAAAKQARRSRWPELAAPVTSNALEELIGVDDGTLWIVLHESAEQPIAALPETVDSFSLAREIGVVVGPEGGITEAEIQKFTRAGAHLARLGPEVLRSSSAGAAAFVVLNLATGRWRSAR